MADWLLLVSFFLIKMENSKKWLKILIFFLSVDYYYYDKLNSFGSEKEKNEKMSEKKSDLF